MAISDRIKAEARRTIDGMQKFYEKYSDDIDDAEELEHRIARVEAAMDGCNGLSQEDKIQKTAENLFELTCAQERTYDALRRELKVAREQSSKDFEAMREEIDKGFKEVAKKIEDSGSDSSASMSAGPSGRSNQSNQSNQSKLLTKVISEHPILAFNAFIFILILVFISGHFEMITKMLGFTN